MEEDLVYIGSKEILIKHGWVLLAGQPPRGCDALPVVEIKSEIPGKGSNGAFKPDLIAFKGGIILIVECKPIHSGSDVDKLDKALGCKKRLRALFEEISQRKLFARRGIKLSYPQFVRGITGAIAHAGPVKNVEEMVVIALRHQPGRIILGENISDWKSGCINSN